MTLALLVLACTGKDPGTPPADTGGVDCPTPSTWYLDQDGDGFGAGEPQGQGCVRPEGHVANDLDCDDGDPEVNPHAVEVCDGVDNNCDGLIDDPESTVAMLTCLVDSDGDGYGVDGTSVLACACQDGMASIGGDCDDTDPAVNPGAEEICDGIDNNCDGLVDPDLTGTWYEDADGDGYGDASTQVEGCPPTEGSWTSNADDCNDEDPTINPGALDICFDLIDQDCDGRIDECGLKIVNEPDDAWWRVYREPDREVRNWGVMGRMVAHFGDSNGNGRNELLVGITEERPATEHAKETYGKESYFQTQLLLIEALSGTSGGDQEVEEARVIAAWETLDDEGLYSGMVWLSDDLFITGHDLDGDGYDDFIFGDRLTWLDSERSQSDNSAGRLHLVHGPPVFGSTALLPTALEDYPTIRLYGDVRIDGGVALLNAADAETDWRVAASLTPGDDTLEGTNIPFAILLGADHFAGTASTDDAVQLWADAPYLAGINVESGDLDGDGIFDLAFGSATYTTGISPGRVWAFLGPFDADRDMSDADWTLSGTQPEDTFGETILIAPDLDDDGRQELVVNRGAPTGFDSGWGTYVFNLEGDCPSGSCQMTEAGGSVQDELLVEGWSHVAPHHRYNPAVLPDTDGDGRPELALTIGMAGGDSTKVDRGVFLYSTPLRGTWDVTDAHTRIYPATAGTWFGSAKLGGVDYDGDGMSDIVIGEYYWDPDGVEATAFGRFMVFRGAL